MSNININLVEQQIIKSLDKGLRILEIIASSESPVSISQLGKMLEMNRSNVFRHLTTLKARGYVINPANSKAFVLGSAVQRLSNQSSWMNTLMQVSKSHLITLAEQTGETAHIAILEGSKTIIVDNEMSPKSIGVTVKKGDTGLIHCTSVGKALILDHTKEELTAILGNQTLKKLTPNTITDLDALVGELYSSRPIGYVVDDEEYIIGVRCIGVPIRDITGKIIAALGVSAPLTRMPEEKVAEVAKTVKQFASAISEGMGVQRRSVVLQN